MTASNPSRTKEAKRDLVQQVVERLAAEIDTMARAARSAHEAATHEESKPENDKDTRALEAAYLAGAQAERVRDLEASVKMLQGLDVRVLGAAESIRATAVVTVQEDDAPPAFYLLLPHGGGTRVAWGEASVQVVTPQSPVGRALLGRSLGDVVELRVRDRTTEIEVVDIW